MPIKQCSHQEYLDTMVTPMTDVTESAEPAIDIWPYVRHLAIAKIVEDNVYENELVEMVYRNRSNTFDHVLLPGGDDNVFVIIIVDLVGVSIKGYYVLDLNKEYGISS